jgi:NADH dehydrogenase
MNIVVIGALGDVGSAVAKSAVEKGHRVAAFDVSMANMAKLGPAQEKVSFFEGDVMDKASILPAMQGVNAVIATLRLTPEQMKKGRGYQEVELQGIKNVVEAAKEKGAQKFVHISVDGVGPNCVSDMYQAKFQAEEAIRNSGMDYTIFRSSGLFKDFDAFFIPQVLKMGDAATTWFYGPLDIHLCPLSHFDLAHCMVSAADNPKASNKTIAMGGPDCLTQGELLHMIAREAGVKANYTTGMSKEALIQSIKANPQQSFFTAEQISDFIVDSKIDHSVIRDMFGVAFQRVGDYLRQSVPRVKAAMASQPKQ